MQIKPNLVLYAIIILIVIAIIIMGCIYREQEVEIQVNDTNKLRHDIIAKNIKTIETETDKEVDAEKAVEPIKDEPIFHLTDYERWVAECIVMGESGGESYEGQILVAQCILNACLKNDIQPSEVKTKYKYSGWKENPTKSVKKAVSVVFDLGEKIVDEPILYFYAPSLCESKWHETQIFIVESGGHRFFKEKSL